MKPGAKIVAMERMQILIESAVRNAKSNPILAERHAALARRISSRHKIRMPYHLRMVFCKKCKLFIAPGVNSRFRLGGTPKSVKITCNLCGHTYRKML
ncbi:MAG: RNase P subunit [Nitrosopumilus sp. B06]|nr:MAG: RNase P subunit [Nitrosopumilus sp. D6]RNJ79883.1 MAG: RNase P subunit [Nitrosopumilus sp. B06]